MKRPMSAQERAQRVARVREAAAQEAERLFDEALRLLEKEDLPGWEAAEKAVRDGAHRMGATILESALGVWGNGYEHSVLPCECGKGLRYVNDRERRLVSLLGPMRLRRAYYRCPHCGETRFPLDVRLGITGTDFSPSVRQVMARLGAHEPFAQGRQLLGELTGLWISSRSHRLVSETAGGALPDRTSHFPCPAGPRDDLYLLADGVHAPTREGWREVKLGVAFTARPGRDGLPCRLHAGYFADVLEAETFGERWFALAQAARFDRARRLVVLADGAPWIWNLVDLHFPGAIGIVDWYHALERLWATAHAVWGPDHPAAAHWVHAVRKLLRNGQIERLVARIGQLPARAKAARDAVRETQGYFSRHADRMRYRRFRRLGLFIGSGVVEAGCKHIVGSRLKGPGMRWSLQGLRDILALRLAVLFGPWPPHSALAA